MTLTLPALYLSVYGLADELAALVGTSKSVNCILGVGVEPNKDSYGLNFCFQRRATHAALCA